MSKKRDRNKQPQTPTSKARGSASGEKGRWQYLKLSYAVWSFIFGIIGPISIVYSFYPSVSVPSSSSLDKGNPFSAPFIISNQSMFTMSNVQISYKLKKVNLNYGKSKGNIYNSAVSVPGAEEIRRHQSITRFLTIDRIIGSDVIPKIDYAQVDLTIRYK
jgi:hypothetical protein